MEERVHFTSDGLRLCGILEMPQGRGGRVPAVMVLHGFGSHKDSDTMRTAAKLFASLGYAALRFDMRGCGESEGERGRVIPSEEIADALNAVTYMAARPDVDPGAIALCGSSLGGGVAVQAAGIDRRVAAVIVENGVAHGERMIRGMHSPESWSKFLALLDETARHKGPAKMIHRFDIFEMPKQLQVNLTSNDSLMQFTADTALAFFMFRPEDYVGRISPRPILVLHSTRDTVTSYEEAFSFVRLAKPPVELHLLDGTDHFMFVNPDRRVGITLRTWLDRYFPIRRDAASE
jgi:fermentation-respiration switch protein FrsA (DUF1100 family)